VRKPASARPGTRGMPRPTTGRDHDVPAHRRAVHLDLVCRLQAALAEEDVDAEACEAFDGVVRRRIAACAERTQSITGRVLSSRVTGARMAE